MGRDGLSVVEKVRLILDCYVGHRTLSLSFAELLAESGLSRASVHRTLAELVDNGLLAQSGQREEYRLGPMLRSVAALVADASSVPSIAGPHMDRLRDECGETIVLAELHDAYVVVVLRSDGLHEMRMNQEVGRRYPPHAGATGKVLLAHLPRERRDALLGASSLESLTSRTVTDPDRLREDLQLVAEAGVGVTLGERVPDAIAISAPVFDAHGRAVAALTISGIASRYDRERLVEDARRVKRVAEDISTDAGRVRPKDPGDPGHSATGRRALEEMCDAAWAGISVRDAAPASR